MSDRKIKYKAQLHANRYMSKYSAYSKGKVATGIIIGALLVATGGATAGHFAYKYSHRNDISINERFIIDPSVSEDVKIAEPKILDNGDLYTTVLNNSKEKRIVDIVVVINGVKLEKNTDFKYGTLNDSSEKFGVTVFKTSVDKNPGKIEIRPKLEDNEYVVTFKVGDDVYKTQQVKMNQYATEPEKPYVPGKVFLGWFTDSKTFVNKFNFKETKITNDLVLYACMEECTDIQLSPDEMELGIDNVKKVTAYIKKGSKETLTWTVSDPTVIEIIPTEDQTVVNVKGLKAGTANVICTTTGGNVATCKVTVTMELLKYNIISGGVEVSLNDGAECPEDLLIPETFEIEETTYNVVKIADNAFKNNQNLVRIILPFTVKTIGVSSFEGCKNLQAVEFYQDKVVLGRSDVEEIKDYAFKDCTFEGFEFAMNMCKQCPLLNKLGNYCFENNIGAKAIEISSNIISIGINPFAGCTNLQQIHVDTSNRFYTRAPNGVDVCAIVDKKEHKFVSGCLNSKLSNPQDGYDYTIGEACFKGQLITDFVFDIYITSIEKSAFENCINLAKVNFNETILASIPDYCFKNCNSITEIDLSGAKALTKIGKQAFSCLEEKEGEFTPTGKLGAFEFPSALTSIGEGAFEGQASLKVIDLSRHDSFERIDKNAFRYCYGLRHVVLNPNTIKHIHSTAFNDTNTDVLNEDTETGCVYLKDANGNDYFACLGFNDDSEHETLNINEGCMLIADEAFMETNIEEQRGLKEITIPGKIISIGDRAFASFTSEEGVLTESIGTIETINDEEGPLCYIGEGAFEGQKELTSFNVRNAVEYIGKNAFLGCSKIEEINFSRTDYRYFIYNGDNPISIVYVDDSEKNVKYLTTINHEDCGYADCTWVREDSK